MTNTTMTYLKDYEPLAFHITRCDLEFDIDDDRTLVTSYLHVKALHSDERSLWLHGEKLQLESVYCNGRRLLDDEIDLQPERLLLPTVRTSCQLKIVTIVYPHENTELEGLYKSGGIFCTQNEPEGFRRITYFIDRPDNMTRFTTKIIADKQKYPVLLSNGNQVRCGDLEGGRHYAVWEDPFVKPSYLFALVAGDLGVVSSRFTTCSHRNIALNIYCDKGNEHKCTYAMQALKDAMAWDEEQYGREYDLDIYNIVAVESFNMGAMENKGLNIFNSAYVLANADTATDQNFLGIESVIAHEYFHNWTGNRITCRDWFQLTLKEGLTVFRDQCFSADMNSSVVQRIRDVKALRERQFVEDAGPTAHSIKPDAYMEINNFYTATIYEKGAEVIRMFRTLLGEHAYRQAMDLYFETFDAKAVCTEDFIWAMQQHCRLDLKPFQRWYTQMRTPQLQVSSAYNAHTCELKVTCKQIIPDDVDGKHQEPYMYPLRMALLNREGRKIPLHLVNQPLISREILLITQAEETFTFEQVESVAQLSLNRDFSAPIKLHVNEVDRVFLMQHDDDGFVRYESAQEEAIATMMTDRKPHAFVDAFGVILHDESIDLLFKAELLELPSLGVLMQEKGSHIDVAALYDAREDLMQTLAMTYKEVMQHMYRQYHEPLNSSLDASSQGKRALKNRLLSYLMRLDDASMVVLAQEQYANSLTMTDRIAALTLLEQFAPTHAAAALQDFYRRYADDTLTLNKYFALQAASEREGVLERVKILENDALFDSAVPNRVRALFGSFTRNHRHFHAVDGQGYDYIAEKIIALDRMNPAIASGLAGAFKQYPQMQRINQQGMQRALTYILQDESLSKNVYEIVHKILHHGE
ncbi:MAG: aminopeptidase N [Sulfurimonas sp.]|nr:MAG: aminopeptidase N [Sulfurimonas sp.]